MADASFYFNKGMEYYDAKHWPMAIEQFTLAIRVNPRLRSMSAYFYRGLAYYSLPGYDEEAIQDMDVLIQFYPNNATYYSVRSSLYTNIREHGKAYRDKDKACSLDSQYC